MAKSTEPKILGWNELIQRVAQLKSAGRRVVHCHGVFDLLHIGHIRYLQRARELGDSLIVTVTPDRYVNKGPHRPAFAEQLRVEAVAALDCVDGAALNCWPTASEALASLRPTIYAKGAEFRDRKTPELIAEENVAAQVGTEVAFIEELTSSSTQLINRYLSPFTHRVEAYLAELRNRFTADEILATLRRAKAFKVLVVGETIIDEYYACAAIGQSMKAPVVTARYESHERFASGAAAVANHLAAFCGEVQLLTMVGDQDQEDGWIRERLRGNIELVTLRKTASPTITKRRYREWYFETPLFSVNFLNTSPLSAEQNDWLHNQLQARMAAADAVVVADYGHAMLGAEAREQICGTNSFLAVSTQTNAANYGLHTISKYRRADYFSLAQRELELECRDMVTSHDEMLQTLVRRLRSQRAAVTFGGRGSLLATGDGSQFQAPALATRVVDRIGAGDAFFAVSTLCALLQTSPDIHAFLGNLAGAEAVAMIGNAQQNAGDSLARSVQSLMR